MTLERGIMNTEELEQVAMSKTYNDHVPDWLTESIPKEDGNKHIFDEVPDILARHAREDSHTLFCENDFSYLRIKDDPWTWHLLKLFNGQYGMVLDDEYIMDYSASLTNSQLFGAFSFRKGKEFLLEYRRASLEEFVRQMQELEDIFSLVEHFETERNQKFYEYENDAIYCYQNGYIFRLSGYTRNSICEYFQMYTLLLSFTSLEKREYRNHSLLKYVYLVEKHGLDYLYKGIDLRKQRIDTLIENYKDILDVVTFSIDEYRYFEILDIDYYISKRKNSYPKTEYLPLEIDNENGWSFKGSFRLGLLGTYEEGELAQFEEIFKSSELKEREKKELLFTMVEEKEQECLEKKDYIASQILLQYFKKCLKDPLGSFHADRWIDFLRVEKLSLQEVSVETLENWIVERMKILENVQEENIQNSEEWHKFLDYIDMLAFQAKVLPQYLTITPLFLIVECEILGKKNNYIITEDFEVLEWSD